MRPLAALSGADRTVGVIRRAPLPYPAFWLAALASLGERIDRSIPLPRDEDTA